MKRWKAQIKGCVPVWPKPPNVVLDGCAAWPNGEDVAVVAGLLKPKPEPNPVWAGCAGVDEAPPNILPLVFAPVFVVFKLNENGLFILNLSYFLI